MLEEYDDLYEKPKKNKLGIIAVILLVLVVAFAFFAIKIGKEQYYQETYDEVVYQMLDNSSQAETLLNKHLSVWYNSIWNVEDINTDEWTKDGNGYFYDDFNDALEEFYDSDYYKTNLQSIYDKDYEIDLLMKDLQNPPKKYSKAYDELVKYYGLYKSFVNLELNPSSYSYNTLSELFSKVDDETLNQFYVVKAFTTY